MHGRRLTHAGEQLTSEAAGRAETTEDLNGSLRSMMKQMLDTEMNAHLGCSSATSSAGATTASDVPPSVPQGRRKRGHNRRNLDAMWPFVYFESLVVRLLGTS